MAGKKQPNEFKVQKPGAGEKKPMITVSVTPEQLSRLNETAEAANVSRSEVVRQALDFCVTS